MKDLLIIREEKKADEAILSFLRTRYISSVIDFDSKQAEYITAGNGIRLLVAFIDEISAHGVVELRRMLMYMKNVDFCLLGTRDVLESHEEFLEKDNVHCLELPMQLDAFQRQFERMLARNTNLMSMTQENAARNRSILLVDDDPVCLRNMMNWLKNFYQVAVVTSGAACISFLGKSRPDLILLDYEMPVCNGVQTLEMIRNEKDYADIPVVFLTSVSDTDKVKEALKQKPQGYILKNTDRVDFLTKVNKIFGN